MPAPVTAWMYGAVHRGLHGIKIVYLVYQWLVVDPTNMRIKRTKQDRHVGTNSMQCMLAEIKVPGKICRRDIGGIPRIILHLLITTLHSIGSTICNILKYFRIIQRSALCLASCYQYSNSLTMFICYSCFQSIATQCINTTGSIAETNPWNTCIGGCKIALNA